MRFDKCTVEKDGFGAEVSDSLVDGVVNPRTLPH